jgi:hypothetical protein
MKAKPSECESVAEIMKRVSHADLLSHYFGINSLPVLVNSPLRKDKHPSFFIYSPDGEKVFYKDYATGDKGDIYTLLKEKEGLSFSQLLRKIATDKAFKNKEASFTNTSSKGKSFTKSTSELKVKIREWQTYDIEYWESYGIPLKWLKYAEVYPISHKIVYKDGKRYVFHAAKYAYVFVERKENLVSLKVYQPMIENKKLKWHTSNDGSVVGLWTKVPQMGDKLVICSSLKDALCLWANVGIPAIYVQSETTGLSHTAQEVLRKRFKHIFICFDNDTPGLLDGEELALKTGFKNVVLPYFEGGKDISDAYKIYGKEWFIKNIKPLFDIDCGE